MLKGVTSSSSVYHGERINLFFCLSYLEVPVTISLIESSKDVFLIVTSEPVLITFFERLYPKKALFLIPVGLPISLNPIIMFNTLYKVRQCKKKMLLKLNVYDVDNVFFFGTGFCEFECWIIKNLKVRNVYYHPVVSLEHLPVDCSIKGWLVKCLYEMIFNINVIPVFNGEQHFRVVSDKFLKEVGVAPLELKVDKCLISKKISNHLDFLKTSKIMFLCGWVVDFYVDECEYVIKVDEIINSIVNCYGLQSMMVKAHPQCQVYYSKENDLGRIPADIAANILLDHFDVVIGYESATLIEAVNNGCAAISLLRMMEPKNQETRDYSKEYLDSNAKNKVYYPESLNELIVTVAKSIQDRNENHVKL